MSALRLQNLPLVAPKLWRRRLAAPLQQLRPVGDDVESCELGAGWIGIDDELSRKILHVNVVASRLVAHIRDQPCCRTHTSCATLRPRRVWSTTLSPRSMLPTTTPLDPKPRTPNRRGNISRAILLLAFVDRRRWQTGTEGFAYQRRSIRLAFARSTRVRISQHPIESRARSAAPCSRPAPTRRRPTGSRDSLRRRVPCGSASCD